MSRRSTKDNDFPVASDIGQAAQAGLQAEHFTRFSLRTTIMFWFLAISLIPVVFISLVGYHNAVQNRVEDFTLRLLAVSEAEKQDLKGHFKNLQSELARQAWNPQTRHMLDNPENISNPGQPSWEGAKLLKVFKIESNAQDILLINQQGDVLFSCLPEQERQSNLLLSETVDSSLKTISRLALDTGERTFTGFNQRSHRGGLPLAYHAEPIKGIDGSVRGLLIMELGVDVFSKGFGRQNQIDPGTLFYVVDEDLQLVIASADHAEIPKLGEPVGVSEIQAWQHHHQVVGKPDNWEIQFHEVKEYSGLGGTEVLGIIQDLDVLGSKFALVSELPRVGVLAGLKRMGFSLLMVIVLVGILVVLAGLVVAHRMVDPINQLGRVMQRVADGHEVWALPDKGPREICQLTQMFHCMISKLTDAQEVNERQYEQKRRQFELNEKLRGESTLEALSEAVLQYLGEYFGAHLGVFYLVKSRDTFRRTAQFGLHDGAQEAADVHLGQGLVGRVIAQKQVQVLRGLKDDRHKVQTGLVCSYVNNLVVAPIHFGDRVLAVLELGLMEDVGNEELEFLDLVSETVATAINSARSRERVHRLLKETWSQAATLSKQQKELRESNRRFELADQYKSEFLANMSHELRTPLNSLLIMSQVLAENRHNNLSRQEVDSAMTINRAGSDLLLLINDILDLSKVEAGKLDLQLSQFELKLLLMDMKDLFVPLADQQSLEFRTIMGPDLPEFMVSDPLRLTQILKNILNNAFKFTDKGMVTFRVRAGAPGELANLELSGDSPWLVFSVSDTGVGMSQATRQSIFDAFNQGDGSIGRQYGGSGLGLSISKQLCDMLGGQIQVESIEGMGSTFSLYLPARPTIETIENAESQNPARVQKVSGDVGLSLEFESENEISTEDTVIESGTAATATPLDLSNRRILICEDDMRTVFQISEILDELGAEVTLAPSWSQGVTEGKNDHGFDFAIVSSHLADRPGSSSVATWRQECGDPPFPVLALVLTEDGPVCEGADLVGSRPLIHDEFKGLIGKAVAMERVHLPQ
jgi:two-component system, chemotaxis family, sensor kinase CheA